MCSVLHEVGNHVVKHGLDGAGQVKGLAQAHHAVVRMDPDPQDVRLRLIADGLDGLNLVHRGLAG
jgi:hypothetical protein